MRGLTVIGVVMVATAAFGRPLGKVDYGPDWPPPERCSPSERDIDRARVVFKRARRAYDDHDFETAFQNFRDAYLIDCNAHVLLNNMAKALEQAGHYSDAADMLELYRDRGHATVELRRTINDYVRKLRQMADDEPPPTPSATTSPAAATSAPVAPSASAAPSSSAPATAASTPSSSLPPISPPPALRHTESRTAAWVMLGSGVVVTAVGAVLVGVGSAQGGHLRAARETAFFNLTCGSASCPHDYQHGDGQIAQADGLQAAGWVMVGLGSLAAAGGLVWALQPRHGDTDTSSALRIEVAGPGLQVTGAF